MITAVALILFGSTFWRSDRSRLDETKERFARIDETNDVTASTIRARFAVWPERTPRRFSDESHRVVFCPRHDRNVRFPALDMGLS